ncbi:MAG: hypothetical protein JWO36_6998 [Myxococcales bacterium]|nr:hypothetical protein [Myxococcales bacterium]
MAYRGDEGSALEAPTAEGLLRLELGPRQLKLTVANRSLQLSDRFATFVDHKKRSSVKLSGKLVIARDVPREDLGIWVEVPGTDDVAMRRVFGVEPVSLLDPEGLASLRRLDALAQRLRLAVDEQDEWAGDDGGPRSPAFAGSLPIRRAVEIGRGLDKILLADHGDRYVIYARRLFRDRAQLAMSIQADGRITVGDKQIVVTSRFGITVVGDYVRFADRHGADLARVSIPWIAPEDRDELARRIGQLVDRAS